MSRYIAAALLAALVTAAPAFAQAKTLRGKTSQGRSITLKLGADGVPTSVRFRWNLSCKPNKVTGTGGSSFLRPFDQATPDVLNDADTARRRVTGGYRMRTRGSISGQRAGETWTGTLSIQRQFSRRGKVVQTCKGENITWSVS
jgi:hypothetical protein